MINFFRKTRKRLADDNQFLKYSRYAVGEIALVVIGILIALQINNWNKIRLEKIEEIKLLFSLKSEFEGNLQEINAIQNLEFKIIEATNAIYNAIDLNKYEDTDRLDSLLSFSFYNPSFDPKSGSLNNLLSSGKLELISNENLRKLLISWPGIVADMKEEEVLLRNHAFSIYSPFVDNYVSIRNISGYMTGNFRSFEFDQKRTSKKSNYKGLFQNVTFENLLSRRSITLQFCLSEGELVKTSVERILEIINNELNQ